MFRSSEDAINFAPGGVFKVDKGHQLANFADCCNDCGNCDVFCPEDGGPYVQKPRFFGSLATYQAYAGKNGFFVTGEGARRTVHGTIAGHAYRLDLDYGAGRGTLDDGVALTEIAVRMVPASSRTPNLPKPAVRASPPGASRNHQ